MSYFLHIRRRVVDAITPNQLKHILHRNKINDGCTAVAKHSFSTTPGTRKILTLDTINENIIKMEYAVRGPLVQRAIEIQKELDAGASKPFKEILRANIGDCHAMGQPYITFLRNVLALTLDPTNMKECKYPDDAKLRAQTILDDVAGKSIGSYPATGGIRIIRKHVAEYICQRDNSVPANYKDIYLTAGASLAIKSFLSILNTKVDGLQTAVMVPKPQYPLYSATIAEFGMKQIDYYLNEENNWSLDIDELQRSIDSAEGKCAPRVIVVINPGNPTGQVLTEDNIKQIIKFAYANCLLIFADEVYQHNVYDQNSKFHSFKKVMMEMGEPYYCMELASFMSCSKGFMGECGIRGGYIELVNVATPVRAMYLKLLTAMLSPTTTGQVILDAAVNPPQKGEPSYEQFEGEKNYVLSSLKERAEMVHKELNTMEGFSCNPIQGAMYAFPQIKLPANAIAVAKKIGKPADVMYAWQLLEETGICIVPGSGFGQKSGTYHFRMTILPQMDKLKMVMTDMAKFHRKFMEQYK